MAEAGRRRSYLFAPFAPRLAASTPKGTRGGGEAGSPGLYLGSSTYRHPGAVDGAAIQASAGGLRLMMSGSLPAETDSPERRDVGGKAPALSATRCASFSCHPLR